MSKLKIFFFSFFLFLFFNSDGWGTHLYNPPNVLFVLDKEIEVCSLLLLFSPYPLIFTKNKQKHILLPPEHQNFVSCTNLNKIMSHKYEGKNALTIWNIGIPYHIYHPRITYIAFIIYEKQRKKKITNIIPHMESFVTYIYLYVASSLSFAYTNFFFSFYVVVVVVYI